MWYDEIKNYDFSNPGFASNTGHFTQVIWKKSSEIGLGMAKSESGKTYFVAHYLPAGNILGEFDKNVIK